MSLADPALGRWDGGRHYVYLDQNMYRSVADRARYAAQFRVIEALPKRLLRREATFTLWEIDMRD